MTPKEQAEDIVNNFAIILMAAHIVAEADTKILFSNAKECAIECVNKLITEHTWKSPISWNIERGSYWKKVLSEIEKL